MHITTEFRGALIIPNILLKVEKLEKPERIATSVIVLVGSIRRLSATDIFLWFKYL